MESTSSWLTLVWHAYRQSPMARTHSRSSRCGIELRSCCWDRIATPHLWMSGVSAAYSPRWQRECRSSRVVPTSTSSSRSSNGRAPPTVTHGQASSVCHITTPSSRNGENAPSQSTCHPATWEAGTELIFWSSSCTTTQTAASHAKHLSSIRTSESKQDVIGMSLAHRWYIIGGRFVSAKHYYLTLYVPCVRLLMTGRTILFRQLRT
mmetsp:Transcript_19294/g.53666  ORF Transcript_19294/g.53666 Transcript_19294/m.53666 type:complete len:207 (+) Transcript_19294:589-1209(+)